MDEGCRPDAQVAMPDKSIGDGERVKLIALGKLGRVDVSADRNRGHKPIICWTLRAQADSLMYLGPGVVRVLQAFVNWFSEFLHVAHM